MKINFIAPDPKEFVSGGNIYNAGLATGLRAHEAEVRFTSSLRTAEPNDISIIDTIYFDRLGNTPIAGKAIGLIHHLNSLYPMSPDKFEYEDRLALDRMDGFIVSSNWTAGFLARKGYDRSRIHIAEPIAPPLKKKAHVPAIKLKALMLNNLVERKGILPFLEHLAKAQLPPFYELRIIGSTRADPEYAKACADIVRNDSNLCKTVKFLGTQDDSSVMAFMHKSNLFISTSFMETFGMSIQEAALTGLPLLVLEGGNAGNHVAEKKNGWKANNIASLVGKFEQLANAPQQLDSITESALGFDHSYPRSWVDSARSIIKFISGLG